MSPRHDEGVAIIGMGCVFPGAPDVASFWENILAGRDAIADVPAGRWDPVFYDPGASSGDRLYCRRGGFIDEFASFDAARFGIMPLAVDGTEPDQLLALETAQRALEDAGYADDRLPRDRTSVVLGRGGYTGPAMMRHQQHVRTAQELVDCVRVLLPNVDQAQLQAVKSEFQRRLGHPETEALGIVPNLTASRIANRLDLHGPAYTVDAACASSLVALEQAFRDLTADRCDLALAGGVHLCHDVTFWNVFCRLGALSRSQQIRPFDRRADGLLIGEGVGLVVLKRTAEALRDGDRIYAVVRATGLASDGRESSLMQPRVEGQLKALERAWTATSLDPRRVGLIEAHGTGTPTGDGAELTTLSRFFGTSLDRPAGIGSVKSMIGHAMPAAGVAGLIKAALAIFHEKLPPTLHCEQPHELLESGSFRPIVEAEPWISNGAGRVAAVNAFGFGGINAHAILEAPNATADRRPVVSATSLVPDVEQLLVLAANTPGELLAALSAGRTTAGHGPCRLALLDPTAERRERARRIVERGKACSVDREGLWFAPEGLVSRGGKVAFLLPGVDAEFSPRVNDVAAHFGLTAPSTGERSSLESLGLAIVEVDRLLERVLRAIGVVPDALAGHSIGEWAAMIASGIIPPQDADAFIASVGPETLEVPGVEFAAVGCGVEALGDALDDLDEIAVSHDNCPHQVILCGHDASIRTATDRLRSRGVLCQRLPFRSGFHSPLFGPYLAPHRRHFGSLALRPASLPCWSATTCAPYPEDADSIRELAIEHLIRPVRFRELLLRLHDEGFRVFVQVGTGRLIGFVSDTLRGRTHRALRSNVSNRTGLAQLRRLAAALWVEGVPVRFDRLPLRCNETTAGLDSPVRLRLGAPLGRITTPLVSDGSEGLIRNESEEADPLIAAFRSNLDELGRHQRDVFQAWRGPGAPKASSRPGGQRPSLERELRLSLATHPELEDHCFFRQPAGWPTPADRFPVMPLTTIVQKMIELAAELDPGRVPVAVERVLAYRWLAVEPSVVVQTTARHDGVNRVHVELRGYASATVVLADRYPAAPPPRGRALERPMTPPIDAETLYRDRWMFHGARFQGVRQLGPVGRNGIRGTIESLPTPGAVLDNAGQLFGYWMLLHAERDWIVFPYKVDRIAFYSPHPDTGAPVDCTVWIEALESRTVRADVDLLVAGRVWARIEGWDDRRFECDERLWLSSRFPERCALGEAQDDGYVVVRETWNSSASRELLARRFLGSAHLGAYLALDVRSQRRFLLEQVAMKDAVREWLWSRGRGPIFPAEILVERDAAGRPVVRGPFTDDLRVGVATAEGIAVARVDRGVDVQIDDERLAASSKTDPAGPTGARGGTEP